MKKKIEVRDLKTGMYVYELDRPWRETPFLFQGFQIESDEDISQLKQHCEHVFIDPDRSRGTVSPIQARRAPRPVPAERKTGPKAEPGQMWRIARARPCPQPSFWTNSMR